MTDEQQTCFHTWLEDASVTRFCPAAGGLRHPYIDPGSGYEDILWEWDSYFCLHGMEPMAAEDPRVGLHARGCVDNFLEHQGPDGHVPYAMTPKTASETRNARTLDSVRNTAKPLLTQFARLAIRCGGGDVEWLRTIYPQLCDSVKHWYSTQMSTFGLLTWRSHRGSGADNHPAYFQRPHNTVADPYLNSMMVVELEALAACARDIGENASIWVRLGSDLRRAIEQWMWDPIDGTYYCIDVASGEPGKVRTDANWAVPLKFRACSMWMPLWAGVASPERAARVVREHMLDPDHMRSEYGLRTLSRMEPAYQIFADYNPSDWCGPVWVINTYLGWEALRRYGYGEEARDLKRDHLAMLQRDVEMNQCLHEHYHPETGEGLTHPGFINWNTCALRMMAEFPWGC